MTDILPDSYARRRAAGSRRIGGLTGSHPLEGKVSNEAVFSNKALSGNVYLSTAITVAQGYSRVELILNPDDFRAVIDKMIKADREATLLAVAELLVDHHAAAKEKQDAARQQKAAKPASIPIPRI